MLALLPDIHANLEALEAVLADARTQGTTHYAAPGDIIGFGGSPVECAERIRALGATALRGNHEAALLNPELFAAFPAVQRMSVRTRRLLPPPLLQWLTTLPHRAEAGGLSLTHASFHSPECWGRLRDAEDAALNFAATAGTRLAVFGHTHRPTLFCRNAGGGVEQLPISYDTSGSFVLHLKQGCRYLVNPGSVGQPRDGDPRAAYALWDADARTLTLRRVAYDTAAAARGTLSMGLPEPFATALHRGVSPL